MICVTFWSEGAWLRPEAAPSPAVGETATRPEGMNQRETAAALGCSEGTVKSQGARALGTLRHFLDRTESTP